MPKKNHTEVQKAQREDLIRVRRAAKDILINQWIEAQKQKILQDTDPKQKIEEEQKKIDRQAGMDQARLEMEMKDHWARHINKLEAELKDLDTNGAEKLAKDSWAVQNEYNDKIKEAKQKYQQTLIHIEEQHEESVRKSREENERFERNLAEQKQELEKKQAENKKKLDDINNSIDQTIEAINMLNESINGQDRNAESPLEKQIAQMKESLGNYNSAKSKIYEADAQYSASMAQITEKLSQQTKQEVPSELVDGMNNSKAEAEKNYQTQLEKLEADRQSALIAGQNALKEQRTAKAKELKEAKEVSMDPKLFLFRSDTIKDQANIDKYNIEQKLRKEAEVNQRLENNNLAGKIQKLKKRVYDSVDFDLDVEELRNVPKKKANTQEFDRMISALQESAAALGKCELTDEAETDIRTKCLEAYKACECYVQAKNSQNIFVRMCRTDNGKARIRLANAMKRRLVEFYPGLEQALLEEREQAKGIHNGQNEAQNDRPSAGARKSNAEIQNRLNAAKQEINRGKAGKDKTADKDNSKKNSKKNSQKPGHAHDVLDGNNRNIL